MRKWVDKWLPKVWGVMWLLTITGASFAALIWISQLILKLLGVM